jgi:signal transduction histidine kinase
VAEAPAAGESPAIVGELSLQSLLELGHELAERNDLFEIADVALFNLMGHFGCSKSALWVIPEGKDDRTVELLRAHGVPATAGRALGAVWSRWLAERPNVLREPMTLSTLARLGTVPGLDLAEASGLAIVAPLATRRRFLGLIALGKRVSKRPFGVRDQELLGASLDFLGLALENSRTRVRLVESNRQLRSVNERLEEMDRLKNEFLSNLNHELRTPLTIIVAYLDSVLQATPTEDPRTKHLGVVRDETRKLETMLMNLLEFRELQDEALGTELRPTDLAASLRAWVDEYRPGITAGLRELRFAAAGSAAPALCDERRVRRILDCLLDNAQKFTPVGTVVQVRVECRPDGAPDGGPSVRVEVHDDGPGIRPEHLEAIWDSFRQVDGSSTRRFGGLGLGLAFARRLAARMNGTLDVESVPGRGATFRLVLPAA